MTKIEKIQQQCLREKAAALLNKSVKQIKNVEEHYNGATVYMKSGCMPWINIPLTHWIGCEID